MFPSGEIFFFLNNINDELAVQMRLIIYVIVIILW